MAIAIAIKIFGRADKGASRPSLALPAGPPCPRGNVGGGRGAGDCKGRCATSWPCLSPQLLPLLTKIKANRDKSRFIEHGRRRQGEGPDQFLLLPEAFAGTRPELLQLGD